MVNRNSTRPEWNYDEMKRWNYLLNKNPLKIWVDLFESKCPDGGEIWPVGRGKMAIWNLERCNLAPSKYIAVHISIKWYTICSKIYRENLIGMLHNDILTDKPFFFVIAVI